MIGVMRVMAVMTNIQFLTGFEDARPKNSQILHK